MGRPKLQPRPLETYREEFNFLWEEDASGCWLWLRVPTTAGYGMMQINGRHLYAHRVSYELNVGPIPRGLMILHSCDTPACVNPKHLRPGTAKDNTADSLARGRHSPGKPESTRGATAAFRRKLEDPEFKAKWLAALKNRSRK